MRVQKQPKGQSLELIYDLRLMIDELFQEYYKANNSFPKRIVFLRDGVSVGQFSSVCIDKAALFSFVHFIDYLLFHFVSHLD